MTTHQRTRVVGLNLRLTACLTLPVLASALGHLLALSLICICTYTCTLHCDARIAVLRFLLLFIGNIPAPTLLFFHGQAAWS